MSPQEGIGVEHAEYLLFRQWSQKPGHKLDDNKGSFLLGASFFMVLSLELSGYFQKSVSK